MRTLAERLKWARETASLSARQLDELADLAPGHTALIESGRRHDPSSSTVEALANALNVSLDWLVSGKGTMPSERRLRATGTS